MSEISKIVLSLSLSGAVMILAVMLICKLFRNKISNSWRYYVWFLIVLRLLVPYSPEISLVGTLFQGEAGRIIADSAPVSQAESTINPEIVYSSTVDSAIDPTPNPAPYPMPAEKEFVERPTSAVSVNFKATLQAVVSWLWIPWLLVALILFIRKITLYQSFAKYVRAGQTDVNDETLLMEFGEICEQVGVKRAIELRTNALIASPLLLGIFRPCVILPTTEISKDERRYIYLHELTHYKRGDIFYKWLLQLALCLHWFNPLVYIMVREANKACELSCDAAVIRPMDIDERRGYGDALLKSLESPGSYRESLAAVTLHENSVLLKERLESIKKYGKDNKWRAVISVILCLCIFLAGFVLGAYIPNIAANSEPNGVELTPEGLPIMSASNRNVCEKYIDNISITGMLRRNFSPEDISELVSHGSTRLLTLVNALEEEEFRKNDWFDGAVPADWADTVLITYFPLYQDKIREVCSDIYDAETNTYRYIGGLGGGPALPIVTGFHQNGKLLTIQYTWYTTDIAAEEFRYISDESGELIVELSGDTFRYRSNRVIEKKATTENTDTASSEEGYNIREKYGLIVVNDQYEKMLIALVTHGITHKSWQLPEEIEADRLVLYYHAMGFGNILNEIQINYEKFEEDEGWTLIPAEEIENAVQKHFNVSTSHMRESGYYIADQNVYWFGGLGSLSNAKITSVREDGDICFIAYELYHDIKFIGNGMLKIQIGEKQNEYRYLSNEFTPIPLTDEEQNIKDSLIVVGPDMSFEEKIVTGLAKTGCAFSSWQSTEENNASELISIYSFLADIGEISIPKNVERDPFYKEPFLSIEEVERVVQSHYDVKTEYLRSYRRYDAERGLYQIPSIHSGAECRIVESNQSGNILTITFEIYQALHLDYLATVKAEIQSGGGYKYLSCESEWVGS